jgi:hypothetical protein
LPLHSSLKTTGSYVYSKDIDIGRRTAKLFAETEVKNEDALPRTFAYEVIVRDLNGKTIKTFTGGTHTLQPNEIKMISASEKLANLNFLELGLWLLYTRNDKPESAWKGDRLGYNPHRFSQN